MPLPSEFDLVLGCLLVGGLQLAVTFYFLLKLRADLRRPRSSYAPKAAVIVPCAGEVQGLLENAQALLDQDYAGEAEFVFVVPSSEDPAYRSLEPLRDRARLLASGAVPERCSGKIADLLFALEGVPGETELLVFADADVRVGRDWLSSLAAPLEDAAVGVSTSCSLPVPPRAGFWSWLRLLYMGAGMPYLVLTGTVCGQSFAVRRKDFDAWGAARLWSRSLMEDLSLSALAARMGRPVYFSGRAVSVAREVSDAAGFWQAAERWTAMFRLYFKRMWLPGLLLTAFKGTVLVRALVPPVSIPLLAVLFAVDAANLFAVFLVLRLTLPDRFRSLPPSLRLLSLSAALGAPLLQLVHLAAFLSSLVPGTLRWGRRAWRVRGPQDAERLLDGSPAAPLSASALCLLALSSVLPAAGYLPGGPVWLPWVALVPLFWLTGAQRPRNAFLLGWLYGTIAWIVGLRWFAGTIDKFTDLPLPGAIGIFVLLCAYHGLLFAFVAWAPRALAALSGWGRYSALWAAAPAYVAVDGLFPQLFPATLALTQLSHLPTVQCLELFGSAGPAWLIAAANVGLYAALHSALDRLRDPPARIRWGLLALAAAAALANEAYGRHRLASLPAAAPAAKRIAVVQGSIPVSERFVPGNFERNLAVYRELTEKALGEGAELVVWPQNSYERELLFELGDDRLDRPLVGGRPLEEVWRSQLPERGHVLIGAEAKRYVRRRGGRNIFRRHYVSVLKGPGYRLLGVSAKRYPTPFGEYIPLGRVLPFLYKLTPHMVRIWKGPQPTLRMLDRTPLGAFICYDVIRPEAARSHARTDEAGLLIAQASDAYWFDDRIEPVQHLRVSVLRAIENRRWLVRAVTSGISCFVAPTGRVLHPIGFGERGYAVENVPLTGGRTLYSRIGGFFYQLAALFLAGAFIAAGLRRRNLRRRGRVQ